MNWTSCRRNLGFCIALSLLAYLPLSARAQSCQTSSDLEEAPKAAITAAGQRFFDMAAKGDVASLRQNAIPSLAADFSGIETTVKDHQPDLAGAQGTVKSVFLLDGTTPVPPEGSLHAFLQIGIVDDAGTWPIGHDFCFAHALEAHLIVQGDILLLRELAPRRPRYTSPGD